MANPAHVEIVKQGAKAIEKWRNESLLNSKLNLIGADLIGADLNKAYLSRANLRKSKMTKVNLCEAYLREANLNGANLSKSFLSKSYLSRANFFNANLSRSDISGAILNEADLSRAILHKSNLNGANLIRSEMKETNLIEANLSGAKLIEAKLIGADLKKANLVKADLNRANLDGADLKGANLNGANLNGADLSGANLRGANLNGANLNGAKLKQATSYQTAWTDLDLSSALGLETIQHRGRSSLGVDTLMKSNGQIPEVFLRGCGLADEFISYIPSHFSGSAIDFYSCFISYSHEDKSFARRLHDALQGKGIRCWLDEHQILPGDNIYDRIDHGIRVWDKVLLCASKHSLTSGWVDDELKHAFAKEKQLFKERGEEVLSLIPLNLDGHLFSDWKHPKKNQILERLAADFTSWESDNAKFEAQFERVVKALQTKDSGREPDPIPKL
ncbi:Secreted effector protein pipB2 [Gimesia panareensis]|uniref:Secreted effector protein pipB2 n=1 Tax=Gimesia panareensis TaxID=2527978 RepID=A0A518FWB8_9PLAN|nr:toll/interleukin-1 receptor domain-containing protein [Gimesia panareensis]QDV20665.1 Secreted effector protein pipB2 [Gimesia panareensis]